MQCTLTAKPASVLKSGLPVLHDHEGHGGNTFWRGHEEKTLAIRRRDITVAAVDAFELHFKQVFGDACLKGRCECLHVDGFEFRSTHEKQFLTVATPGWFSSPAVRDLPLASSGRESLDEDLPPAGLLRHIGEPMPIGGQSCVVLHKR